MSENNMMRRIQYVLCCIGLLLLSGLGSLHASTKESSIPLSYGYNGVFLRGGDGIIEPLDTALSTGEVDSPWSITAWVWMREATTGQTMIAGWGDPSEEYSRYFEVSEQGVNFRAGHGNWLKTSNGITPGAWHFLAATFDGVDTKLYLDGKLLAHADLAFGNVSPVLQMAPITQLWPDESHFSGKIASFQVIGRPLTDMEIAAAFKTPPDFSLINYALGSPHWPVQTQGSLGMRSPQDPATLPRSGAPFSKPVAVFKQNKIPMLHSVSNLEWNIDSGWKLIEAGKVTANGASISTSGYSTNDWLPAIVPGTVLTTMIDDGIYPDPNYGVNNLAIPESLNKQSYWYRTEFESPVVSHKNRLVLTFHGINYAAEIWLNGHDLGKIRGAFIRGKFDVSTLIKPGSINTLAVFISPPPHPGIPHEQSMRAGPGPNGGMMCLDGPTFVATEGWDWIPAVRDRDSGIWQDVTLAASGGVTIGDSQVITKLPLPDISSAKVFIKVPLDNSTGVPVSGILKASFGTVVVTKSVILHAGETVVSLTPDEFRSLTVPHPRLWWPNGYGEPNLYTLHLSFTAGGETLDEKQLLFGIREVTYELSLLDASGELRRVEISPTTAALRGDTILDVTHDGIQTIPKLGEERQTALQTMHSLTAGMSIERRVAIQKTLMRSWVSSLAPGAELSPAVRTCADTATAPYLVIKVNGVRIAARGGNWGMDDMLKRVSRTRLEPYFRLERDANINIIRNWVGQNTEETFYELADKYGLMVWNDFWDSTQDYNLEPQDPQLFLKNARDTILRFRNHPSIVLWCGRNEGVPPPILNEGLSDLIQSLDGTRYYSPSSNQINLQTSGPYSYKDPKVFYTTSNRGFSVEVGTPSMPTLESFRSFIPKPDQWPVSDAWAYHDWHQAGNGDIAPFLEELTEEFGAPTSLQDFERKAQMLNYVDHRAIFEGFNAHLWSPNSGRMLWMTQPAWPSTMWQILSHDYDTQASFYAVKKACEPIHVQLDIASNIVEVVDTTREALPGLVVNARVYSLTNKLLWQKQAAVEAAADALTQAFPLDLQPLLADGVVFVQLELQSKTGKPISSNFYWIGKDAAAYRQLGDLPQVRLSAVASASIVQGEHVVHVRVNNDSSVAALEVKLTLQSSRGTRILPAYLDDNYFSLLPGEKRTITVKYSSPNGSGSPQVAIRGWNVSEETIAVPSVR